MSRRTNLKHHYEKLGEAREIVNSMKSLSFIEVRRLGHFLDLQRAVVGEIERAAADFSHFYPELGPRERGGQQVLLVVGAERGFCGSFNQRLLQALQEQLAQREVRSSGGAEIQVVGVGHKLCTHLEDATQLLHCLDGAAVADEVGSSLNRLLATLTDIFAYGANHSLSAIYHDLEQEQVVVRELLPPFTGLHCAKTEYSCPPELYLAPSAFLFELVEHYLYAVLHEILYVSLMAENHQRMQHLEGAVRYLDENMESLRRKANQQRQEEITEEIEVILLSAESTRLSST